MPHWEEGWGFQLLPWLTPSETPVREGDRPFPPILLRLLSLPRFNAHCI